MLGEKLMSEIMNKKWVSYDKDYSIIEKLKDTLNISEVLCRVLVNRNIDSLEKAEKYLNPNLSYLYNPYDMLGMEKAVIRITDAINSQENICIYGDYDVDGITSISALIKTLRYLNANVTFYIPSRIEEGYGLNIESVQKLMDKGVNLFITVDCGIRSDDVVAYINKNNIDIIITDHHECGDTLPAAYSVINPHQKKCNYPFKELAGVGVAFKLIEAILSKFGCRTFMNEIIDIVCIGTIADVVPLVDENRVIVKNGLIALENTKNIGLNALLKICVLNDKKLSAQNVAYLIAPRINAVGRIADANLGVDLLLTEDKEKAIEIAQILEDTNKLRQNIESEILSMAVEKISNEIDLVNDSIIVLSDKDWNVGVVGIVAARITERYGLPTILIAINDNMGRGSARSILGINIIEAINQCSHLLARFGGHELAAGLSIEVDKINEFRKDINKIAKRMCNDNKIIPSITVDYKLSPLDINIHTAKQLETLEPFGCGNQVPFFVFRDLKILSYKTVGNEKKHLSLRLSDGKNDISCIGYNLGIFNNILSSVKNIDIICSIEINVWNDIERVQLVIKDIKIRK